MSYSSNKSGNTRFWKLQRYMSRFWGFGLVLSLFIYRLSKVSLTQWLLMQCMFWILRSTAFKWCVVVIVFVFCSTDATIKAVFTEVGSPLFAVAIELILSANRFLMFLVSAMVRLLNILKTFINHVPRMFIAVGAHRNQVLEVALPNQQQGTIPRREKKVAYHRMILMAALLICLVPPFL